LALAASAAGEWLSENWFIESLREDVKTSAENESSVVLYGDFDGQGLAGVIEREERYCEIGARRMQQEVLPLR
jgi:hypothetical protein